MHRFWKSLRTWLKRPEPFSSEEMAARVAERVAYMQARARPCLRLATEEGDGLSWFGGASFPPLVESPRGPDGALDFLAQLDLDEVYRAGGPDWLPTSGRLLFFIDPARFDHFDQRTWAVRHVTGQTEASLETGLTPSAKYARRTIGFQAATSWPLYDRSWDLAHRYSEEVDAAVEEALGWSDQTPAHQIGGYPRPIQSDFMEAECQEAWAEMYGGPESARGSVKPTPAEAMASAERSWRLLLQMDSDETIGASWRDGGTLYFWIREEDARVADFSRVWLIMQYY